MFKLALMTAFLGIGGKIGEKLIDRAKAGAAQASKTGSMIRNVSSARVEPITVIDQSITNYERIDDLLHFTLNTFSVVYMQGVALSNKLKIDGMTVAQRLQQLKPAGSSNDDVVPSFESEFSLENEPVVGSILKDVDSLYKYGLPSAEDFISLEANRNNKSKSNNNNNVFEEKKDPKQPVSGIDRSSTDLKDSNILSVGKVINVDITDSESNSKISIPVSIRLASITIRTQSLIDAMKNRFASGETAMERKVGWKQGRLSLIKDVLLCKDIRKNNFKNLITDGDGIRALNPHKSGDFKRSMATGTTTLAGSSSILLIDSNSARQVESRLGGRFENYNFRQKMLEQTGVMIFGIVDQESDMISIYFDTIATGTDISGRNLSKVAKNDGPDLNQALISMAGKQTLSLNR